jgi:hypothetical protein
MKSLACVFALFASAAFAGTTIDLPSPIVNTYYPTTTTLCTYQAKAWTSASGFSADGNYVQGISYGYLACGHSGRLPNLHYTYYCMFDMWDLSGNLASVTVQPYTTCAAAMQSQPQFVTWTNAGGYEADTITNVYYGYIQSRYAVLVTP